MTAADDGLQAALVEALRDLWAEEAGEEIPDDSEVAEVTTRYAVVLAADPRVRAAMDRRAAEELEAAADEMHCWHWWITKQDDALAWLRARADALAPEQP